MAQILIVEDDQSIANLIRTHLTFAGHEASIVSNGRDAVELIQEELYDMVILDLMLPKLDGEIVMEHIRKLPISIIVVSAKSNLFDQVKLLRMGADDYITKPFESVDLIARVEAVLRRYKPANQTLLFRDITVDENRHKVNKGNTKISLTPKEFELLVLFLKNKGNVMTREEILANIWGYTFAGGTRTVDIHVQRLRKKLNLNNFLKTVVKIGYILEDSE